MSRFLNSGLRFLGLPNFVGRGKLIETPIPYSPSRYAGAALVAQDGNFYYSDGTSWKIPNTDVLIGRPFAQTPIKLEEKLQLRLSAYFSPGGLRQGGAFFEISTNGVDFDNPITKTVNDEFTNLYQLLYPEDGFEPGDEIYWRALYFAQDGTQSEFSEPFRQTMPPFIETPEPVTGSGALTSTLQVEPFASAYGWEYVDTEWEVFEDEEMTIPAASATIGSDLYTVPGDLEENKLYWWRARHIGRPALGQPSQTSEWSGLRTFNNAGSSMVLVFDLSSAPGNTVKLALGWRVGVGSPKSRGCDVEIDWGDGTVESFSGSDVMAEHTYDPGQVSNSIIPVVITGTCTSLGAFAPTPAEEEEDPEFIPANSHYIEHLTRIDSWGFGIGLESINEAVRGAINLEFVSPDLPMTVTDMSDFANGTDFVNGQIAGLKDMNTASIKSMARAFRGCESFDVDLSGWDVANVTDFSGLFSDCRLFTSDLSGWDVSSGTNFGGMFENARSFTSDLSGWDVSGATDTSRMFSFCNVFNADLANWDVSNVANMDSMFLGCREFNANIANWNVSNVTSMRAMFMEAFKFAGNLANWDVSNVTDMNSMFCVAKVFNADISNWDTSACTNMSRMFREAAAFNQDISAWNVSNVTDMSEMFVFAILFNQDISTWNTAAVTNMRAMFSGADVFNQDIGGWNTAAVTDMSRMFENADAFNQDISTWNTAAVTNMEVMFFGAVVFNQDIGGWDTSNVTNMRSMFGRAFAFNYDLSAWDVSKVTDFSSMFVSANNYQQPMQDWVLEGSGITMEDFLTSKTPALSTANYSKSLTGWANSVFANEGPYDVLLSGGASTYHNTVYDAVDEFSNAYAGRDYLTKPEEYTVSGASNANANGVYTISGLSGLPTNSNGWYFDNVSTTWTLYDGSDNSQAEGFGDVINEVPSWTGALSGATVIRTGPGWTITDGGAV